MRGDDLQAMARCRVSDEERRRMITAELSLYENDPDNVVPYVPHTEAERLALGMGGGGSRARKRPGR